MASLSNLWGKGALIQIPKRSILSSIVRLLLLLKKNNGERSIRPGESMEKIV